MSIIRRTDQGGSVVAFILISLMLVIGLAGMVYYVNQRGEQARKDQEIADANQQIEEPTVDESINFDDSDNEQIISESSSEDDALGNAQDLPMTGPNLLASELVGAFLITVSTTSYLKSRNRTA